MNEGAGLRSMRWWTALRAAWDLTRFWVLVRVRPQTLAAWCAPAVHPSRVEPDVRLPDAARVVAIVGRVARVHPLRPACLEQALAACAALRRRGTAATIVIGVRREGAHLAAHAWVDARAHTRVSEVVGYAPLEAPVRRPATRAFIRHT